MGNPYLGFIERGDRFGVFFSIDGFKEVVVRDVNEDYVWFETIHKGRSHTDLGMHSWPVKRFRDHASPVFQPNATRPNRKAELAEFLKDRGFPEEAVEYFADKASRDGFITDKEPPPASTLDDPALRAMEDLERAWKYLEIVWAEYNIYGEK